LERRVDGEDPRQADPTQRHGEVEKVLDKQIRHSGMEKWRRSSTSRFRTALMAPGEVEKVLNKQI
jgi:hypothetical protein